MRVFIRVLAIMIVAGLFMGLSASSVLAEDFNPDQLASSGKKVKQVKSPKQYQLYHVTDPEIPNASTGPSHGPLFLKQSNNSFVRVAEDVTFSTVSPDGRTFYIDNGQKLFAMDATGKSALIAENISADFTFDKAGKRIIALRPTEFVNSTLEILSIDGKTVRIVLPEGNYATPFFTPDGNKILFSSADTGIASWYLVNTDGSNKRQLTNVAMASGKMASDFIPVMSTPKNAGFIDDTHFQFMEGPDIWVLDIQTGKAAKMN